ncbi:MAG: hypothetical protein HY390_05050, partial [Deltaproteobacteria bacterium]|nr:hypothetical protein [Deltaproteobacteria bacterium]
YFAYAQSIVLSYLHMVADSFSAHEIALLPEDIADLTVALQLSELAHAHLKEFSQDAEYHVCNLRSCGVVDDFHMKDYTIEELNYIWKDESYPLRSRHTAISYLANLYLEHKLTPQQLHEIFNTQDIKITKKNTAAFHKIKIDTAAESTALHTALVADFHHVEIVPRLYEKVMEHLTHIIDRYEGQLPSKTKKTEAPQNSEPQKKTPENK